MTRTKARNTPTGLAVTFGALAAFGKVRSVLPRRRRTRDQAPRVLVVYPAGAGSLGDEAILEGVMHLLADEQPTFTVYGFRTLPELPPAVIVRRMPRARPRPVYLVDLLWRLRRFDLVLVLGADMLDGAYSADGAVNRFLVAAVADSLGIPAVVVGFSWNGEAHPVAVDAARRLPGRVALTPRDPISRERLESAIGRPVQLCADPAFHMCEPQPRSADRGGGPGTLRLGLNLTDRVVTDNPAVPDAVAQLIAGAGVPVVVQGLPHDLRRATSDWDVLVEFTERTGIEVDMPPKTVTAREIRRLAGGCDLVITCRMHAAVGSLAEATPTLGLGYQGKFEGLAGYFGLTWVPDSREATGEEILALAEDHLRRRVELAAQIEARLPDVLELSRAAVPLSPAGG
jgi:colanic acid/amylovoran biosynthesis protein